MIKEKVIENIPNLLVEKNINFLIGSGASFPYFPVLGNLEDLLSTPTLQPSVRNLIYAYYFNIVIRKNINLFLGENVEEIEPVQKNYYVFIDNLVKKMQIRNSRLSPTRANIFTTNYDLFFEITIDKKMQENPHLFLNDGANGHFNRILSADNYHKTMSLNGVFDNYQKEIPMINLIKCHGSVTWSKYTEDLINVNHEFKNLKECVEIYDSLNLTISETKMIKQYIENSEIELLKEIAETKKETLATFIEKYSNLLIINPEKNKFHHTVLNEHYYSMLRLLSYELEREQTILIVFGFSFADEHIRKLILRSLNNPFLQVYIFCYSQKSEGEIKNRLGLGDNNLNIHFISPDENETNIGFEQFNNYIFGRLL
jgi:hypothetical protein